MKNQGISKNQPGNLKDYHEEVDLLVSVSEEDSEAIKIRDQRLAAYEATKSNGIL